MKSLKLPRVSGSALKIFAIISMMIDHTGAAFIRPLQSAVPSDTKLHAFLTAIYPVMRNIGRLAFPIFCFLLVEGFIHTRSAVKYAKRLFIFALLSELPFDFALAARLFSWRHQNVYFTLLIGLLVMMGVSYFERNPIQGRAGSLATFLLQAGISIGGLYLAKFLYTDYGFKGVFLIEILYWLRLDRRVQAVFGAIAISWEKWAPFAFLPILLYNGKRGRQIKYFFYWFYPVHLTVLGFLKLRVTGSLVF